MMAHAGRLFGGQQIAGGSLEELGGRFFLERRRIRHVDDGLRAAQRLGQAFAGKGVDAGTRRGGDDLMAPGDKFLDELGPDASAASDDDDLHVPHSISPWRFIPTASIAINGLRMSGMGTENLAAALN